MQLAKKSPNYFLVMAARKLWHTKNTHTDMDSSLNATITRKEKTVYYPNEKVG
jgi:hypothetical protein